MQPRIHVAPPANWVNDPNGPILWNDRYHLFYQHNPDAPIWGNMHWGHAVSDDLATWTDLGIALTPTAGSPDADGCWSGCARVIDGRPTLFYTGLAIENDVWNQSVCQATGDDDLLVFTKDPANPVIPASSRPDGHQQHRDPFVFRDEPRDRWVMIQGTGIATDEYTGGAVVLYDSPDAEAWTYRGVLCTLPDQTGDLDTGPVWECPAMFEADGTWVLILSVQLPLDRGVGVCPYSVWFTGSFDGDTFAIERRGILDHGDMFYAPALLAHPDGRQLMWGWVQESAPQQVLDELGSAGALTLPREVSLVDGEVVTRFARELEVLWSDAAPLAEVPLTAGEVVRLGEPGSCWRLRAWATASGAGVRLGWDGDDELTLIAADGTLEVRQGDRVLASAPAAQGEVEFDLIVDGTVVELHTARGAAVTTRLPYSHRPDLALLGGTQGGTMRGVRLQAAR